MGAWQRRPLIRWSFADADQATLEELAEIPGVKIGRQAILAPDNAAWIVDEFCAGRAISARRHQPPPPPAKNALRAVPWLREWVVEPGFLTSYQREGVAQSLRWPSESGLFVWSAGSGKTLGGIIWALSAGPARIVVVTKAAIRPSWDRQIREYTRGVELRSLIGETADGEALAGLDPSRPAIFITGYDTLPSWIDHLERLKPTRVIFDEVHRAKSHQRWDAETTWEGEGPAPAKPTFSLKENQAAACYRLSRASTHRLGLTATPIRDRVRDLWAQLDLVRPWDFGGFWQFAKRYCAAIENPWGGMDTRGSSNLVELKRRLTFVSHHVPHSLANRSLPPARRLVIYVPIAQQARGEGIGNLMRAASRHGPSAILEARLMEAASRKRKIITDHVLDAIEGRLKVVIFTGRKIDVESLRSAIMKKAPQCPIWAATGSDSPEQREIWRDEWMRSPGPAIFVATGESMGEGLDMQDCDLGIMAMLPYTPGQVIQYEGRWVRLGMKRPVEIRYFVAEGTIDEHVSAILLDKLPAIERTVDLDEVRGLTSELAGDESELIASLAAKCLG